MTRHAILVFFGLVSVVGACTGEQEDPYLSKAIAALEKAEFPKPSPEQQRAITQLTENIQAASRTRRYFHISDETATAIGRCGVPQVAPLLRSADPWVRGMTAETLLALDRRESVPFLVGLLLDNGSFDWMDDVRGVTVGSRAANALHGLVYQTIRARLPADEQTTLLSERKALQTWFTYHTPYYDWEDHPKYGLYRYNGLALHTSTPAAELPALQRAEPKRFTKVLVIWPEDYTSHAAFSTKDRIRLRVIFQNFGTETTWIRWDKTDRDVHVLRLIDPTGKALPLELESIPPLGKNTPLLQPVWSGGSALGWEIDLNKAYDLSNPGGYRLYYTYRPPADAEPKEQATPTDITFWDGRRYVKYYEFMMRADAEPSGRGDAEDRAPGAMPTAVRVGMGLP